MGNHGGRERGGAGWLPAAGPPPRLPGGGVPPAIRKAPLSMASAMICPIALSPFAEIVATAGERKGTLKAENARGKNCNRKNAGF